jgi:hypothetical protein
MGLPVLFVATSNELEFVFFFSFPLLILRE